MDGWELTWRARRSGREPPRAACAPSQGVRRQATRPSLPAATLWPATAISTSHMPGASCQTTKLPSWHRPAPLAWPAPAGSCSIASRTLPAAYMLLAAPSSFPHPVVALNCSIMYCADDATCVACAPPGAYISKSKTKSARATKLEGRYA